MVSPVHAVAYIPNEYRPFSWMNKAISRYSQIRSSCSSWLNSLVRRFPGSSLACSGFELICSITSDLDNDGVSKWI